MSKQNLDLDVIIVGGGPGGSTAGYILSKLGLDVLIIDKRIFPRPKLCGGLISLKTLDLLKNIFKEPLSTLQEKGVINYYTSRYEINYKFEKTISKGFSSYPFYFVDRRVYDNYLLKKAKEVGTKVIEGNKVKQVDLISREVLLSNGVKFKSKFIIGADGVNSVIRQEFIRNRLIKKNQWQHNLATALECFIDRNDLKEDKFHYPILSFGFVKYGYAWLFPNKEKIIIGVGALNRKNNGYFVKAIKDFMSALKINLEIVPKISGHPIPYGNFDINPVFKNNVILIGDAGGVVDPLWGEGIFYAQKTAEFASFAILKNIRENRKIESTYLGLLREYISSELKYAKRLRGLIFSKINTTFNFYPLKLILKFAKNRFLELIQGVRSYKWLLKKSTK